MQRKLFVPTGSLDLHPFSHNGDLSPVFTTAHGALFKGYCSKVLPVLKCDTVDTVFADPPFNLGKDYGSKVDDARVENDYLE